MFWLQYPVLPNFNSYFYNCMEKCFLLLKYNNMLVPLLTMKFMLLWESDNQPEWYQTCSRGTNFSFVSWSNFCTKMKWLAHLGTYFISTSNIQVVVYNDRLYVLVLNNTHNIDIQINIQIATASQFSSH